MYEQAPDAESTGKPPSGGIITAEEEKEEQNETGAAVKDEVQTILGTGENGVAKPDEVRQSAVEALVYGNERWDGGGYPEGRRGDEIPLVARAFAVCRRWDPAEHNGDGVARLRSRAAHELDPKMVQRFAAMLRAEMAEHN